MNGTIQGLLPRQLLASSTANIDSQHAQAGDELAMNFSGKTE